MDVKDKLVCEKFIVTQSPTGSHWSCFASKFCIFRFKLSEFGLNQFKPACKQRLTTAIKSKRLILAKQPGTWTAEDWSIVKFSDESILQQFVMRKRNIRRQKDLVKRIQYSLWSTHKARWFWTPYPNVEQLNFDSCLHEQWWMVQGMWNNDRKNWNCIRTHISWQYSCIMVFNATSQWSLKFFFQEHQSAKTELAGEQPRSEPS